MWSPTVVLIFNDFNKYHGNVRKSRETLLASFCTVPNSEHHKYGMVAFNNATQGRGGEFDLDLPVMNCREYSFIFVCFFSFLILLIVCCRAWNFGCCFRYLICCNIVFQLYFIQFYFIGRCRLWVSVVILFQYSLILKEEQWATTPILVYVMWIVKVLTWPT